MQRITLALAFVCLAIPALAQETKNISLEQARHQMIRSEKLIQSPISRATQRALAGFRVRSEAGVASRAKSFALSVPREFRAAPRPQSGGFGDFPRSEFFIGYTYTSLDPGVGIREYFPGNGWNAAVTGNFTSWFGLVGDFSGAYGEKQIRSIVGVTLPRAVTIDYRAYTLLGGPQFTARGERVSGFARVMAGVSLLKQSVNDPITQSRLDAGDDSAFAFAFGGGVDTRVTDRVAWRVAQVDYVLTRFKDFEDATLTNIRTKSQHNFKVSTGLVFR